MMKATQLFLLFMNFDRISAPAPHGSKKFPCPENSQPFWPEGFLPFPPVIWHSPVTNLSCALASVQNNEMKARIFRGKVIIVAGRNISVLLRLIDGSLMSREIHVRFWEGVGGSAIPHATRYCRRRFGMSPFLFAPFVKAQSQLFQ